MKKSYLSVVIVGVVLTGCGGGSSNTTTSQAVNSDSSATNVVIPSTPTTVSPTDVSSSSNTSNASITNTLTMTESFDSSAQSANGSTPGISRSSTSLIDGKLYAKTTDVVGANPTEVYTRYFLTDTSLITSAESMTANGTLLFVPDVLSDTLISGWHVGDTAKEVKYTYKHAVLQLDGTAVNLYAIPYAIAYSSRSIPNTVVFPVGSACSYPTSVAVSKDHISFSSEDKTSDQSLDAWAVSPTSNASKLKDILTGSSAGIPWKKGIRTYSNYSNSTLSRLDVTRTEGAVFYNNTVYDFELNEVEKPTDESSSKECEVFNKTAADAITAAIKTYYK